MIIILRRRHAVQGARRKLVQGACRKMVPGRRQTPLPTDRAVHALHIFFRFGRFEQAGHGAEPDVLFGLVGAVVSVAVACVVEHRTDLLFCYFVGEESEEGDAEGEVVVEERLGEVAYTHAHFLLVHLYQNLLQFMNSNYLQRHRRRMVHVVVAAPVSAPLPQIGNQFVKDGSGQHPRQKRRHAPFEYSVIDVYRLPSEGRVEAHIIDVARSARFRHVTVFVFDADIGADLFVTLHEFIQQQRLRARPVAFFVTQQVVQQSEIFVGQVRG
mmetsp:Transcript_42452/g.83426  ORF Transcript_42452/g.83426 Transcript_42452/m.83426 type:complete len:270 (+) Transcript_42452:183-992(+)